MILLLPRGWRQSQRSILFDLFISVIIVGLMLSTLVESCNEAVCASIVSKCTLLKSCECEIEPNKPCKCCDRCKKCLDYLLTDCCSCVGLCHKPNITSIHESVVFDFDEPVPSLWDAVTKDSHDETRWDVFTYPVDLHPAEVYKPFPYDGKKKPSYPEQETFVVEKQSPDKVTVNCTVAFLRDCIPRNKCKTNCATMGASHGRWFSDGCCECVGHNCREYGVNESRCSSCSAGLDDDELLEEYSDEEIEEVLKQEEYYAGNL